MMSTTRTAVAAILGGALTVTVLTGTAGSASAKPIWCEPAAANGCSTWQPRAVAPELNVEELPPGLTLSQYRKLLQVW